MIRRGVIAAAGLILAVVGACASTEPGQDRPDAVEANATVLDVTDGDTITADIGGRTETVRLIGIDTPETVDPRKPVQCFGEAASARTKELLPVGTPVRIERDVEARDRYGRLLGYVSRSEDGLFVNLALVADGFAQILSIPPNITHAEEFRAAESAARSSGAGLWSACPTDS